MTRILFFILLLPFLSSAQQTNNNNVEGVWEGAGLTGQKDDAIMGTVKIDKDFTASNQPAYQVFVTLQTPADRNKLCDFAFKINSLQNINVRRKDIRSIYPDNPVCSYLLDNKNNYKSSKADICFSSVKIEFIRHNNKPFVRLLLMSDHEMCAGKLYLSRPNYTLDELNVHNLYNDYETAKRFHDSVSAKTGKTIDENEYGGEFDQTFIREKSLNKSATFEYFPEDEILLIYKPYISVFSLHLRRNDYAAMDKSGNFKLTNAFFNMKHMWLMNAQITGLVKDKTFYFPSAFAETDGENILKKYLPSILEKEAAVNTKIKPENKVGHTSDEVSQGTNLLFKGAKTKLTQDQKQVIYKSLNFKLSAGDTLFVMADNDDAQFAFDAIAYPTDLNADGSEEVFISYGNTYTSGMAGRSAACFIKNSSGNYTKSFELSGGLPVALETGNNHYPDLLIIGPGMQHPVWRWNGNAYAYHHIVGDKSVKFLEDNFIDKLSENYQKTGRSSMHISNESKKNTESAGITKYTITPPTATAKKLILKRWKMVSVVGSGHESFERMKESTTAEWQFAADGKCYVYRNGILQSAMSYTMAPDGKSFLVSNPNGGNQASAQIISIRPNELVIRSKIFQNDAVIFR